MSNSTSPLNDAVIRLRDLVRHYHLAEYAGPASPEQLLHLQRRFLLPEPWIDFYRALSPRRLSINTRGNEQALLGPDELNDGQEGYDTPDWPNTWIVVGGEGEYPLIVDVASNAGGVLYGSLTVVEPRKKRTPLMWTAQPLSENLTGFVAGLSTYIQHFYAAEGPHRLVHRDVRRHQFAQILHSWEAQPELLPYLSAWQAWLGVTFDE
ncbi:hypothetical protein [Deinococcus peraridilitoris]|uniref:Knr4/Smi1-like domain-containing protein n=1 Tax=Deinococcus peraridilitoris (strain DSM 19664 / LMG 22246 / CIP 109416 / KR-200) TaxID=937777 RepID=L0A4G9_DEIPD|nr:hypothetical protein [Deinococcus peraridilitoris]AFZ68741.1 hypothetical protein Deipe_3300 [Deinococcus peraridilitoris DSM 19664]